MGQFGILPACEQTSLFQGNLRYCVSHGSCRSNRELVPDVNLFVYRDNNVAVVRAVTNQFFLEKSAYISKLSRNVDELEANLNTLLTFFKSQMYRVPATETLACGTKTRGLVCNSRGTFVELTHYIHPYKGKFHPKMARALINYVCPNEKDLSLTTFQGAEPPLWKQSGSDLIQSASYSTAIILDVAGQSSVLISDTSELKQVIRRFSLSFRPPSNRKT